MLEARKLSFSYDHKTPVLESADLSVSPGEAVLITGKTGSGKTTLALCLSGFIPRSIQGNFSGSIHVNGEDVSGLPASQLSKRVALVQQDPDSQICTLKVSDEVAFGPENYLMEPSRIRHNIESSLASVGASHLADRPTYSISGGEKHRTTIASVLSFEPEYIIFDEASANLDPRGINLLREIIHRLKSSGFGIVCIEHNLRAMASVVDRILLLENGALRETTGRPISSHSLSVISPLPESRNPLLTASKVTYSYSRHTAIEGVSMSIHTGDIIALMGDNGSGKTTLLALLSGLLRPQDGQVLLHALPLTSYRRDRLTKEIGFVLQNPNHQIFEKTVWAEQTLSLRTLNLFNQSSANTSIELLREAGLEEARDQNPFSLSHGQKRRLNITSMLAHGPRILLLDEPFVGQDADGREFITRVVRRLAEQGGAAVIVTHDTGFAEHSCNRITFLENGELLLDGSPKSVLNRLEESGHSDYLEGSE
ncbi:MAG: ABC transporter ATP-binding protein [Candidatus Thorarchaeota archaeon]